MLLTLSLLAGALRCFVVVIREKTGLQDTGSKGTVPQTAYISITGPLHCLGIEQNEVLQTQNCNLCHPMLRVTI
jgi:hypothetical protein